MHNLADTSLVRAWTRTTALQGIGINLYCFATWASTNSDNNPILFEFLDYDKRRAQKRTRTRYNDTNGFEPARARLRAASYSAAPTASYLTPIDNSYSKINQPIWPIYGLGVGYLLTVRVKFRVITPQSRVDSHNSSGPGGARAKRPQNKNPNLTTLKVSHHGTLEARNNKS